MIGGSTATEGGSAEDLAARYASTYRVAYRLLGDAVGADVLARDALVHAGARVAGLRRSSDARACLRAATLALRDELWFGRARSLPGGTGFGEVPHREERRRLRMAVRSLVGRRRKVFVLEQLAGWSPAAVAAELRLSAETHRRVSERALEMVNARCEIQVLDNKAGVT